MPAPTPTPSRGELPIIQATMDLIQWFVPLLNRLPRDHRFALGDRLIHGLYDLLEGLVSARYAAPVIGAPGARSAQHQPATHTLSPIGSELGVSVGFSSFPPSALSPSVLTPHPGHPPGAESR